MNGGYAPPRLDRQLAASAASVLPGTVDRDYVTVLRGLPVLLHNSGLAAAGAYLLSRASAENAAQDGTSQDTGNQGSRYRTAAYAILADAAAFVGIDRAGTALELLDRLTQLDDGQYRIAERRARAFTVWLARLATARREYEEKAG